MKIRHWIALYSFSLFLIATKCFPYRFYRSPSFRPMLPYRSNKTLHYTRRPAIWKQHSGHANAIEHSAGNSEIKPQYTLPLLETPVLEDQAASASDYGHHLSRVHVKVFRGVDDHHHFAPHGHWIKHPEDYERHH